MGRRPCSSGRRSDGLATWKAPEAMNRMWSVFTGPCLVEMVVPSISGRRSRCTPSRLDVRAARGPRGRRSCRSRRGRRCRSFSTDGSPPGTSSSLSSSLSALLVDQRLVGLLHGDAAGLGAAAQRLAEHLADDSSRRPTRRACRASRTSACRLPVSRTSISISLSSSSPARSLRRKLSRVVGPAGRRRARRARAPRRRARPWRDFLALALLRPGRCRPRRGRG